MMTLEEIYPPFALRITCGPMELRVVRDEDMPGLAAAVVAGVHDAGFEPFARDWTKAPADELPGNSARFWWEKRGTSTPMAFAYQFAVRVDGVLSGCQDLMATDYPITRSATTGSWLTLGLHGRGLGTLMRQAILTLMFDHLGAAEMHSSAYADNAPSNGVSRAVGYVPNGEFIDARLGQAARNVRWRCTPETFIRPADAVVVEGAEQLRRYLRLDESVN